jgi:hypothetical protein
LQAGATTLFVLRFGVWVLSLKTVVVIWSKSCCGVAPRFPSVTRAVKSGSVGVAGSMLPTTPGGAAQNRVSNES